MKQLFRFVILLLCTVMGGQLANAQWLQPIPKVSLLTTEDSVYIYNAAQKRWFGRGEAWDVQLILTDERAITGESGSVIRSLLVKQEDGCYQITSNPDGGGIYSYAQPGTNTLIWRQPHNRVTGKVMSCFTDGFLNGNHVNHLEGGKWVITACGKNNSYTIAAPAGTEDVTDGMVLGYQAGHASLSQPSWGLYYDVTYAGNEANCEFQFVKQADFDAYVTEYARYDAAQTLKNLIDKAAGMNINVSKFQVVYENTSSTLDALNESITAIRTVIVDNATWEHPQDATINYITNPNPVVNLDGYDSEVTPYTFDKGNNCAEFWGRNDSLAGAEVKQTMQGLSSGVYTLTMTALTRTGFDSKFFVGSDSVQIAQVERDTVTVLSQANTWFNKGNGKNTISFYTLGESSDVTFGWRVAHQSDYWTVWRDFQLTSYGSSLESFQHLAEIFAGKWEEEFADATYCDNVYAAVSEAIKKNQTATTKEDAVAAYEATKKALNDLRLNVQLISQLQSLVHELNIKNHNEYEGYLTDVLSDANTMLNVLDATNEEIQAMTAKLHQEEQKAIIIYPHTGGNVNNMNNVIYLNDDSTLIGSEITLSFRLKNKVSIRGLQFDLHLPDGFTVANDNSGNAKIAMSTARDADKHINSLNYNLVKKGLFRVVAYSQNGESVEPGNDDILILTLKLDDTVSAGTYPLIIDSIQMTDAQLNDISLDYVTLKANITVKDYTMGDVNNDGRINVTDLGYTVDYILSKTPNIFLMEAADINSDRRINVTDLGCIVDIILGKTISVAAKPLTANIPRRTADDTYADASSLNNVVYLNDITATTGEKLKLSFRMRNNVNIRGVQFDLHLPDGFTVANDENGDAQIAMSTARDANRHINSLNYNLVKNGRFRVVAYSQKGESIEPGDEEIITLMLNVADTVKPQKCALILDALVLTDNQLNSIEPNAKFKTTVTVVKGFDGIILDENATTPPTASDSTVDVKVRRTIKSGSWQTICLPFAMTGEQVKTAFGDDVLIADYVGWNKRYSSDEAENPNCITIIFNPVKTGNGIKDNHPYIIKTSADINEFTVDNVIICPKSKPIVSTGNKRQHDVGSFIGNYTAGFIVPEATLFITNNQFWYSVGKTKMKSYRAYFEFEDVLDSYYSTDDNEAKINISLDDVTAIDDIYTTASDGKIYSLSGQLISTHGTQGLPQGIYIRGGKKLFVK